MNESKQSIQRKHDTEKLAREAELHGLRNQLQPHFLFNSLNSISALVGSRPETARSMIYKLSEFLRGTLKKEETTMVTLDEELKQVHLYLDIETIRFGHRLSIQINSGDELKNMQIPSLILQPIVENAIKYGLYDTTNDITITINIFKENNSLLIQIENPFDPNTSHSFKGEGFGLSSIKRRLYLLYHRSDLLITSSSGNLFKTTLKIPQL
jgi:LytS/YehU family sensor histidine kinase